MNDPRVFAVNTGRNSRGQGLQKFRPPGAPLITWAANGVSITQSVDFIVPIPDSRLRVKIGALFLPVLGVIPNTAADSGSATIWLREADDDTMFTGNRIPTNSIEGTQAAPTAIVASNGLYGYSREFWTAADYIVGTITSSNAAEGGGVWSLQCSCQPDTGQRFSDEEWQEITSGFSPRCMGSVSF